MARGRGGLAFAVFALSAQACFAARGDRAYWDSVFNAPVQDASAAELRLEYLDAARRLDMARSPVERRRAQEALDAIQSRAEILILPRLKLRPRLADRAPIGAATVVDARGPSPEILPPASPPPPAPPVGPAAPLREPRPPIAAVKPSGYEADASAAARKCARLSRSAGARGVDTLVIGFEGWTAFDSLATRAAYRYQDAVASGAAARKPGRTLYFGHVVHDLMIPLVDRYGDRFEFIVFPEWTSRGGGSLPERCAAAWMRSPAGPGLAAGRSLVLIGHSFGGDAAHELAAALARRRVPVAAVYTIDPRPRAPFAGFERPANVERWENYYQSWGLAGSVVGGADVNANLSRWGIGHGSLPAAPMILRSLSRRLGRLLAPPERTASNQSEK
ncbi:MAG: hypothetical protein HY078_05135 [Elusimicrobia bacterium]|nr:hypothetical protein [Elusimicrobiota bacterium]